MKIKIKDKYYNLPNFQDVTIKKGIEIEEQLELFADENIDNIRSAISLLINCDYNILQDVVDFELETIFKNHVAFDKTLAIANLPEVLALRDGTILKKIKLDENKMTTQEWGDIDVKLERYADYIYELIATLYRPVKFSIKNIYINIISFCLKRNYFNFDLDYNDNYNESEIIKVAKKLEKEKLNWFFAKGVIFELTNFKHDVLKKYSLLENEIEDEIINEDEEEEDEEIRKEHRQNDLSNNYGFYYLLQLVSNFNIVEEEILLKKSISEFLNRLNFKLDKMYLEKKVNNSFE